MRILLEQRSAISGNMPKVRVPDGGATLSFSGRRETNYGVIQSGENQK